jgi:Ca-activated chloride channel family protein
MYLTFINPELLLLLFLIPIIIFFHFFGLKNLKGNSLKFANFEAIYKIKGIDLYSKHLTSLILDLFLIVLFILALSGTTLHKSTDTTQFSYVLAIDTSESMLAKDLEPNRLEASKQGAVEFLDSLDYGPTMGVLSFAGDGIIESEVTLDKDKLKESINGIEINPVSGTDIYEAAIIGSYMLNDEDNKAMIIFSDGQINVDGIEKAIKHFKDEKIVVHTIGVGTLEGGNTSFGVSKLELDSLRSLSYNTDGTFINVDNGTDLSSSLNSVFSKTRIIEEINLTFYLIVSAMVFFIFRRLLVSINKISW